MADIFKRKSHWYMHGKNDGILFFLNNGGKHERTVKRKNRRKTLAQMFLYILNFPKIIGNLSGPDINRNKLAPSQISLPGAHHRIAHDEKESQSIEHSSTPYNDVQKPGPKIPILVPSSLESFLNMLNFFLFSGRSFDALNAFKYMDKTSVNISKISFDGITNIRNFLIEPNANDEIGYKKNSHHQPSKRTHPKEEQ